MSLIPQDLHNPSSATASTSILPSSAATPTLQSEAQRLTTQKENIQSQLEVYFEVLKSSNVTMSTPLVDPEGFPRSDIDVAGIRTARTQIIRLRNDLKDVMKEMASLLERGLPNANEETDEARGAESKDTEDVKMGVVEEEKPFARVQGVFPGGPASVAGLQKEDLLVSVGTINLSNHDSLQALGALVSSSENVVLPMKILRAEEGGLLTLHLRLTPKTGWGGRGLLGCHVVPV